jgi:hypothetical protein
MRGIVPWGVADDPWACDAWRARVHGLARTAEALGMRLTALCGAHSTDIDIVAVAERLDEAWPVVLALRDADLSDADAEHQLRATRAGRAHLRTDETGRREGFATVALFGEEGVDLNMPDDAALARATADDLRAALARSVARAPDLLLAGPGARARVARLPEPAPGETRVPLLPRTRKLDATTVFVMHEPTRTRAEVRAGIVVAAHDATTMIGADVLRRFPNGEITGQVHEPVTRFGMPYTETIAGRQIIEVQGADCDLRDLGQVIDSLLALQRETPHAEQLARARGYLETDLRTHRRVGLDAVLYVWSWAAISRTTDPGPDEWLALGALDDATVANVHAQLQRTPVVISVLVDLDRVDRSVLARYGDIVEIVPTELRDPELADRMRFGFPPGPP